MQVLFPYILILLVIFQLFLKRGSKRDDDRIRAFWKRESDANSVRKKDISNLNYIVIPDSLLGITGDSPETEAVLSDFRKCRDMTMLNLSGLSNTDLKMEYGAANLENLSVYDENCTTLLRRIMSCAEELKACGRDDDAVAFLEFGVKCRTDISKNYTMLAEYYAAKGDSAGIERLIQAAGSINSFTKDSICKKLADIKSAMQP